MKGCLVSLVLREMCFLSGKAYWASWNCGFIVFTTFESILAVISLNIFILIPSFWVSDVRSFDIVPKVFFFSSIFSVCVFCYWQLQLMFSNPLIFSSVGCTSMHVKSCQSCPTLCNPWTVAHQAPLSVGFSRQEYWSGLPCPPPRGLPDPGIQPRCLVPPALAGGFFTTSTTWEACRL